MLHVFFHPTFGSLPSQIVGQNNEKKQQKMPGIFIEKISLQVS